MYCNIRRFAKAFVGPGLVCLFSGLCHSNNAAAVAPDNCPCVSPVACWPAEGNANDVVGAHHGTLQNGAGFASGRVGQAFVTDGLNDYVRIADAPDLRPVNLTIEGWFSFAAPPPTGTVQMLVAKAVGDANTFDNSLAFWLNGPFLRGSVGDPINGYAEPHVEYGGFSPVPGAWYHLAYRLPGRHQYGEAVTLSEWSFLGMETLDSQGHLEFYAPVSSGEPMRFYKVVAP
jgi:hypothetical protein